MTQERVVRGGTVVFPERGPEPADILISDGSIAAVLRPGEAVPEGTEAIEASGLHVFPGIIDAHVHFGFGEPLTEYSTETTYAAQGGVTTILAFFLNNEPYSEIFEEKKREAEARAFVDFGFHFSTAKEVHCEEIPEYVEKLGITSFKYFMNFKGEEGRYLGLDGTDDGFFLNLLETTSEFEGVVVVAHPENIEIVNRIRTQFQEQGRDTLRDFCESKSDFTEAENIMRGMAFAEYAGANIYFPHVSCERGLDEVRRYRERYAPVFVETCPHYLTHNMTMDLGSLGKTNPPLRTEDDIEALWLAIADGTVDVVASDHVPRKRATKEGKSIWKSSQGFPGTATILPVLLSEGYHKRGLDLQTIAEVVCTNPANIFGIDKRKGAIAVGMDADLTFVDLDKEREVVPAELGSYSDYSVYEGWTLKGWPVRTMVRGVDVMRDGKMNSDAAGHGRYLHRPLG
ncbi:MAG TPA: amidohydrolase family protein [Alphaproteobacteria bacterium]|nr:amidohydrolase family protein [Alphaproteobacteria bacterium]